MVALKPFIFTDTLGCFKHFLHAGDAWCQRGLIGQTTVSLMRTFRLKRAAELIKIKSATIAEIAYDVGFNSPSYFTECFREYFGKLPSEYSENDS